MSEQREQSHIIGTFESEREALAAKAVKKMLDKGIELIVYQGDNGNWVLARVDSE